MKRKRGQTIHSEARNIIRNVIRKCDEEARKGQFLYPLQQANLRASEYVGVSVRTISRIRKEDSMIGEDESLPSPGKKRPKSDDNKFHCSIEDQTIIRNTIYDFYTIMKVMPTGNKLLSAIQEKIDFPWAVTSLYRLLKRMGFTWKKTHSIRRVLVENPNIVGLRSKYLEAMEYHRNQNKSIVYIGETCVDNIACFHQCWEGQDNLKTTKITNPPHRCNIVHAAGKDGFIKGTDLIFESCSTTDDYRRQMIAANFEKWFTEKLLPNIPPKSVIVMGDIPYHLDQLKKPPSKYSAKKEVIQWLTENNIPHGSDMRKYQLFELVESNKKLEKSSKVDELLKLHEHIILRIPPHMHDLNPMDLAWSQIRCKIQESNTFLLANNDLKADVIEAINEVKLADWQSFWTHIEQLETEYLQKDRIIEETIDNLGIMSSDSESESERSTSSEDE
ncbi:uncharacterized protein LOC105661841 [Megachile rotundata]|uniref:uncharacterized protein LOC105661841 n=1 Tax=Megachile rotundata TaxID=143995 RepID=UPI000614D6F8|nr:PREDICTED: uncharacterized protein LOC105661841 [Megachile rotundata]XP_012135355.1 PREDICTED: uncharacterized protein LOC105661841 [Megachile rotundata]